MSDGVMEGRGAGNMQVTERHLTPSAVVLNDVTMWQTTARQLSLMIKVREAVNVTIDLHGNP